MSATFFLVILTPSVRSRHTDTSSPHKSRAQKRKGPGRALQGREPSVGESEGGGRPFSPVPGCHDQPHTSDSLCLPPWQVLPWAASQHLRLQGSQHFRPNASNTDLASPLPHLTRSTQLLSSQEIAPPRTLWLRQTVTKPGFHLLFPFWNPIFQQVLCRWFYILCDSHPILPLAHAMPSLSHKINIVFQLIFLSKHEFLLFLRLITHSVDSRQRILWKMSVGLQVS